MAITFMILLFPGFLLLAGAALWYDLMWTRYIFLAATLWQLLVDGRAEKRGGRPLGWVQRLPLFDYVGDYFPSRMHIEEPLDPDHPHIISAHPHGVIGVGVISNLVFGGKDQHERVGLDYRVCTVGIHFLIPLWREFIMALGFVDVSRQSLEHLMEHGQSAVVVTGGAQEALEAKPGVCRLVVEKRRGLIRLALRYGARVVPAFTWGENELWDQVDNPEGSILRWVQQAFKTVFKWSPVLVVGRGMFQYSLGFLPFRRQLTTVLGKPVKMPEIPSPTDDDVEKHQARYIEALQGLYERYNSKLHEQVDRQGRRVRKATFKIIA